MNEEFNLIFELLAILGHARDKFAEVETGGVVELGKVTVKIFGKTVEIDLEAHVIGQ